MTNALGRSGRSIQSAKVDDLRGVGIVAEQLLAQECLELRRRDALKPECVEVILEEFVKPIAPERLLDGTEEKRSLLVRNSRHPVIGIAPGQVDVKHLIVFGQIDRSRHEARRSPGRLPSRPARGRTGSR